MKIFQEEKSIEILKILSLFTLKKWLMETRNNFLKEIEKNELMRKKYKKVYTTLNYIEHYLILAAAIT